MKILVTGASGFIGSRLCYMLAQRGDDVVGIDNINNYYDIRLKYGRMNMCGIFTPENDYQFGKEVQSTLFQNYRFIRMDIADKESIDGLFAVERFDKVVNLAAQAGVRYSITHPYDYLNSNVCGFLNILEACRHNQIKYLVYASSSSVYGLNESVPYSEDDKTDTPVSLYAAFKKGNELMAHAYSKLYNIPVAGLRYFTVYGPWGRPDMSPMLFASAIDKGESIKVFNNGDMKRDFTYIDDIVAGTVHVVDTVPDADQCINKVAAKVYNIGCGNVVNLMDFISEIEKNLGKEANKEFMPMQPGDVYQTNADTTRLQSECGYKPRVLLSEGIKNFVDWFKSEENPLLDYGV